MADRADSLPPIEPIEFVPTKGSPVIVGRRDKAERIREAIVDLQLVIDGFAAQQPCEPGDVVASIARHCSMFLRKMVIGNIGFTCHGQEYLTKLAREVLHQGTVVDFLLELHNM